VPPKSTVPARPTSPSQRSAAEDRSALHRSRAPVALAGLGLALVTFIVYVVTLSPSTGFIDSGELVTATKTLGIVHPTGYPLYTLLGYVVTNFLPLSADPAWRLNLLSALFGALAVGLLYLVTHRVLTRMLEDDAIEPQQSGRRAKHGQKDRRGQARPPAGTCGRPDRSILLIAVAACSAGLLAASHSFWLWAVQAKVYTLHETFVAALFLVALIVARPSDGTLRGPTKRPLHLLAFLLGLAFTNHTMTVFLIPGLFVLLLPAFRPTGREVSRASCTRRLPMLATAFTLPLLLYLYLPIRSAQQPLMNWGTPIDWPSFYRHVTGWQYRSYLLDESLLFEEKLRGTLRLWSEQFHPAVGALVLILAVVGAARLASRSRLVFVSTALTAGVQAFFALTFGSTPEIHESYFVPFYMMVFLWVGAGLLWMCQSLTLRVGTAAVLAVPFLLPPLAFATNWGKNDYHANHLAPKFIENVYAELAEGALVLTDLWELQSESFYMQHVRGMRTDLTIIDINLARYPWYMDYLERHHSEVIADVASVEKRYRDLQELFVSGRLDAESTRHIQEAYIGVLGGMVRSGLARGRPVHALFQDLYAHAALTPDEEAIIGKSFHPAGLTIRVDAGPGNRDVPVPRWDLTGITGRAVYKDAIAAHISGFYPAALSAIGRYKIVTGEEAEGHKLVDEAGRLTRTLAEDRR